MHMDITLTNSKVLELGIIIPFPSFSILERYDGEGDLDKVLMDMLS